MAGYRVLRVCDLLAGVPGMGLCAQYRGSPVAQQRFTSLAQSCTRHGQQPWSTPDAGAEQGWISVPSSHPGDPRRWRCPMEGWQWLAMVRHNLELRQVLLPQGTRGCSAEASSARDERTDIRVWGCPAINVQDAVALKTDGDGFQVINQRFWPLLQDATAWFAGYWCASHNSWFARSGVCFDLRITPAEVQHAQTVTDKHAFLTKPCRRHSKSWGGFEE